MANYQAAPAYASEMSNAGIIKLSSVVAQYLSLDIVSAGLCAF